MSVLLASNVVAAPASAEVSGAAQAAEMLARAQALNVKCNYLDSNNKAELAKLVVRAEFALAAREGGDVAKRALQRGQSDGSSADCSAQERQSVRTIVDAAKSASANNPEPVEPAKTQSAPEVKSQQAQLPSKTVAPPTVQSSTPSVQTAPATPVEKSSPRLVPENLPTKKLSTGGYLRPLEAPDTQTSKSVPATDPIRPDMALREYASLNQGYFLARRCAPGDNQGLSSIYGQIVNLHGKLIRNHSAAEVARVLRRAAASASRQSCN